MSIYRSYFLGAAVLFCCVPFLHCSYTLILGEPHSTQEFSPERTVSESSLREPVQSKEPSSDASENRTEKRGTQDTLEYDTPPDQPKDNCTGVTLYPTWKKIERILYKDPYKIERVFKTRDATQEVIEDGLVRVKSKIVDGHIKNASLYYDGPAIEGPGNSIYFVSKSYILRKFDFDTQTIQTLTRKDRSGFKDGPIHEALIGSIADMVLLSPTRILFTDRKNRRVRVIDLEARTISTIAGTGKVGSTNGPLKQSTWHGPSSMLRIGPKTFLIYDTPNPYIRKLTLGGSVSTFVGSGAERDASEGPIKEGISISVHGGMYLDSHKNILFRQSMGIRKITPEGQLLWIMGYPRSKDIPIKPSFYRDGPARKTYIWLGMSIVVDSKDRIFISDSLNHAIRMMTPDGMVYTLVGDGRPCTRMGTGIQASIKSPPGMFLHKKQGLLMFRYNELYRISPVR